MDARIPAPGEAFRMPFVYRNADGRLFVFNDESKGDQFFCVRYLPYGGFTSTTCGRETLKSIVGNYKLISPRNLPEPTAAHQP